MSQTPTSRPSAPRPFEIAVGAAEHRTLLRRLRETRFPPDFDDGDWSYGAPPDFLRDWVQRWLDFDLTSAVGLLNEHENYRAELDGLPIHFLHRRGVGPDPIPIVLTHGWPWTYWDWHSVIGPLADPAAHGGDPADAFDVVVPSLPGFGFSPLLRPCHGYGEIADLWARLMQDVLGYDRFAAAGGDIGALVSATLGHRHADSLIGIHLLGAVPLSYSIDRPYELGREWDVDWGFSRPAKPPADPVLASLPTTPGAPTSSHRVVHVREPRTVAAGLEDSPVGLLAWLLKPRQQWRDSSVPLTDTFDPDFLLTTTSIYWFTQTLWSSLRAYRAAVEFPFQPVHDGQPVVNTPTGITFFEYDQTSRSRFWVADYFDVVRASYSPTGGHFAPAEEPATVIEEIRATFRMLR